MAARRSGTIPLEHVQAQIELHDNITLQATLKLLK